MARTVEIFKRNAEQVNRLTLEQRSKEKSSADRRNLMVDRPSVRTVGSASAR